MSPIEESLRLGQCLSTCPRLRGFALGLTFDDEEEEEEAVVWWLLLLSICVRTPQVVPLSVFPSGLPSLYEEFPRHDSFLFFLSFAAFGISSNLCLFLLLFSTLHTFLSSCFITKCPWLFQRTSFLSLSLRYLFVITRCRASPSYPRSRSLSPSSS